jgi:hypothetical protein
MSAKIKHLVTLFDRLQNILRYFWEKQSLDVLWQKKPLGIRLTRATVGVGSSGEAAIETPNWINLFKCRYSLDIC